MFGFFLYWSQFEIMYIQYFVCAKSFNMLALHEWILLFNSPTFFLYTYLFQNPTKYKLIFYLMWILRHCNWNNKFVMARCEQLIICIMKLSQVQKGIGKNKYLEKAQPKYNQSSKCQSLCHKGALQFKIILLDLLLGS